MWGGGLETSPAEASHAKATNKYTVTALKKLSFLEKCSLRMPFLYKFK